MIDLSPQSPDDDQPLVMKRDKKITFVKLVDSISHAMKFFLRNLDKHSAGHSFFGVENHRNLTVERKKIVEHCVVQLRTLKRKLQSLDWQDAYRELGHILLQAKFQSFDYYMKHGQKPMRVDELIDSSINRYISQTAKINTDQHFELTLKALMIHHYIQATKQLYDNYSKKSLALLEQYRDDDAIFPAIARFHRDLAGCNNTFQEKIAELAPKSSEPVSYVAFDSEQRNEITQLLNEQKDKLIELEPNLVDLRIVALLEIYTWGVTVVSRLQSYVRGLNEQFMDISASHAANLPRHP